MSKFDEIVKQLKTNKQSYIFDIVSLFAFILWMAIVLLFRDWTSNQTLLFYFGFIPNFFAAIFFFFHMIKLSKDRAWLRRITTNAFSLSLLVFLILLLGEIIQGAFQNKVFDWLDLLATLVGLLVSCGIFYFVKRKYPHVHQV